MLSLTEQKAACRRDILAQRQAMGAEERQCAADNICQKIRALPQYQAAQHIAAFAPMAEEVNIWPLIEESRGAGKTVVLPRVSSKQKRQLTFHLYRGRDTLQAGFGGILEPPAQEKIFSVLLFDFIIVPAVAIDKNKKRLGYGGGFYDKVLASSAAVYSCAPIFRCQMIDVVPCEKHDKPVQAVITND